MTKRVAFYLRIPTGEQTKENQRWELEAMARHRGWDIVAVYEDQGISGAKGRDRRPQFEQMLRDAVRGRFDIVAAWAVDRLGRSLQGLVATLGELRAAGGTSSCISRPSTPPRQAAGRCSACSRYSLSSSGR